MKRNGWQGIVLSKIFIFCFLVIIELVILFPINVLADDDDRHTANIGNISLVFSNYGTIGLAFAERGRLSCEYPIGSHIEHIYRGGFWFGGRQNYQTKVSTGAVDVLNRIGRPGFEFTTGYCIPGTPLSFPADSMIERSTLPVSQYYDPNAISHQDLICEYTDSNTCVPQTGEAITAHDPLGIVVRQEAFAWSQSFANAYVIFQFTIKNTSQDSIEDAYAGYWIDTNVGNTDITVPPRWGPVSSWNYDDDGNNYIDSIQMAYEYDYDGEYGYAESYIGMQILGTTPKYDPQSDSSYLEKANFYEWMYNESQDPVFFTPQNDNERYNRMATGLNKLMPGPPPNPDWRSLGGATGYGNRTMLVSTGPFPTMAPGDSVVFVFAIICASKYGPDPMENDTERSRTNLFLNSRWAKISYENDYKLPEAPPPPSMKVVAGDTKAEIYWDNSPESFVDPIMGHADFEGYKIYRARITQENQSQGLRQLFEVIGQFDRIDSIGYDTGLDFIALAEPETLDGHAYYYKYTNENLLNGWQYAYAVTAFDTGDPTNNLESLESSPLLSYNRVFPGPMAGETKEIAVFPNPYKARSLWDGRGDDGIQERDRLIYFANLPDRCTIRIYTISGDLVDTIEHDGQNNTGADLNWFKQYASGEKVISGGIHGWDLVTKADQALATGMYLFAVEDKTSGNISRGKFVIIK